MRTPVIFGSFWQPRQATASRNPATRFTRRQCSNTTAIPVDRSLDGRTYSPAVVSLLVLLCAATAADAAPRVIDVDPSVIAAARRLGPRAAFFTGRAHPLAAMSELHDPAREVGTAEVAGAKEAQSFLRAAGLEVGGGAVDLMRLASAHHFRSLFRAHPELRLFIVQARDDGAEAAIVAQGGGLRVQLRAGTQTIGALESKSAKPAPFVTSFGPLTRASAGPTARQRDFDPRAGATLRTLEAAAGKQFVVLHIDRDFAAGVGVVSFLFGSGIIVKPAFDTLTVSDAAHHRYPLAATHAEGRTLELGYQVPAGARGLTLRDGDDELPLDPLLAGAHAAGN
jgi:hypothetical protein